MGRLAGELDMNCGYNASAGGIGQRHHRRAVRLILTNIGGASPGVLDRATLGSPAKYTFCFAENEAESPWGHFMWRGDFAECEHGYGLWSGSSHNVNDHAVILRRRFC